MSETVCHARDMLVVGTLVWSSTIRTGSFTSALRGGCGARQMILGFGRSWKRAAGAGEQAAHELAVADVARTNTWRESARNDSRFRGFPA
jgi:hypothetical protein